MRGWRRTGMGAVVAILAAIATSITIAAPCAALAGASTKPIPPSATARPPSAALEHFIDLVAGMSPHDLPRLSDPDTAPTLRTIWAAAGTGPDPRGYGPKTVKDDVIVAAMVKSTLELYEMHVLDTYLLFPTPLPHPEDFDMARPMPAGFDAERVAKRFAPEVAGSLAASIVEVAEMSVVLEVNQDVLAEGRPIKAGARKLRAPSLRLVSLAQTFMQTPAFGPDNAARVAAALADHASDFAVILSQKDRAAVASSFEASAQHLPAGPARRDIGRFVDAVGAAPCGKLCQAAD